MTRTTLTFDQALDFSRAVPADYVDATGAPATAAANVARFDHDPTTHDVLGLLVEGAAQTGAPDRATVDDATWITAGRKTILHRYLDPLGATVRVVRFTDDPRATIEALLGIRGTHHLSLVFGYPPKAYDPANQPGQMMLTEDGLGVDYQGETWAIDSGLLATDTDQHLLTAPDERVITGAPE